MPRKTDDSASAEQAETIAPGSQPLCSGCTRFDEGACVFLQNALTGSPDLVIASCTHYDTREPAANDAAPPEQE